MNRNRYEELRPDDQGRLRSRELGVRLGIWEGEHQRVPANWLRFFTDDGLLVPTTTEAEAKRADAEAQRANAAEAEIERLRALLEKQGIRE